MPPTTRASSRRTLEADHSRVLREFATATATYRQHVQESKDRELAAEARFQRKLARMDEAYYRHFELHDQVIATQQDQNSWLFNSFLGLLSPFRDLVNLFRAQLGKSSFNLFIYDY